MEFRKASLGLGLYGRNDHRADHDQRNAIGGGPRDKRDSAPPSVTGREDHGNCSEDLGIAKGRIYLEGESYLLVPGPRLSLAAKRISEIIRDAR